MLATEGAHLFACWREGSSSVQRKPYLCLGPGAMMRIPHADGVGSYVSSDVIWEYCSEGDNAGLFVPLDFNERLKDHKSRQELRRILGATTDQEMLSLCIHGMQWFAGVVGSTRRDDGATRIAYEATPAWPALALHHVLADEQWRHCI